MLYLDHAATTPMRPAVWHAMEPFVAEIFGNSSGTHGESRRAKNALEEARERIATVLGARPQEIVFTGGGTEADNLAVQGAALADGRRGGVVTSAVEHEAVLETAAFVERIGCPVHLVGVDSSGRVEPGAMAETIDASTAVVSLMAANNETGVIQPVAETARLVKERFPGVLVHTDAVQAFSSEDVDVDDWQVDLLSLAAHKFGGPKGVGVLYVRSGVQLEPVLHGGGQELGRRSGTSNVMGAVGMAVAAEEAAADRELFRRIVASERTVFEQRLAAALGARPTVDEPRLPQHAHLSLPGTNNETMLVKLDRSGLAASAGSACQSGAVTTSHVLRAMGLTPNEARTVLRFTFGWTTRPGDGERAAALVAGVVR
ncbi:MAG: cysteine desulfurase [Acidimicrobiia bacterium]|nr:cysteine desulfurase [Acidimicrobiia bacterium]